MSRLREARCNGEQLVARFTMPRPDRAIGLTCAGIMMAVRAVEPQELDDLGLRFQSLVGT